MFEIASAVVGSASHPHNILAFGGLLDLDTDGEVLIQGIPSLHGVARP